ncbi:hypothetical protein ACIQNI_07680 [Streptomyces sp. NPDC091266]|uniref:hypothetical protein n=1 Tax=Streptomyces sp. NPDC091266 TaxID=3365978 RepID=UPI0037FC53B1
MVLGCSAADRRTVGSVFFSPELAPAQARRLHGEGAPVNHFPDGSARVSASRLTWRAGFVLGGRLAEGVRVSYLHHTLVADEGGSAAAGFTEAVEVVVRRVLECTGIRLAPEIDFVGDWPQRLRPAS